MLCGSIRAETQGAIRYKYSGCILSCQYSLLNPLTSICDGPHASTSRSISRYLHQQDRSDPQARRRQCRKNRPRDGHPIPQTHTNEIPIREGGLCDQIIDLLGSGSVKGTHRED